MTPEQIEISHRIAARLRDMYLAEEQLTQIQFDFCAIFWFDMMFLNDGLTEWLAADGAHLFRLPESMARHGFPRTADVLDRLRALFPPEARIANARAMREHCYNVLCTRSGELSDLENELWDADERYGAVLEKIFLEQRDALPDLQPEPQPADEPEEWTINPFTGEPMKKRRSK